MENRINVAELLKDCPKGMELDCTMFENVTFEGINKQSKFPIIIKIGEHCKYLTKEGCYIDTYCISESKCVIFPKGKTTWEGFIPPCKFKDGDILTTDLGSTFILKEPNENNFYYSCYIALNDVSRIVKSYTQFCTKKGCRLATEEEKQKLFQAIKDNGYEWNAETKTLEKLVEPKFKVGDKIKSKVLKSDINTITKVCENHYELDDGFTLELDCQDKWRLVSDKFDLTTLVPFESRVLVRAADNQFWRPAIWGVKHEDWDFCCVTGGEMWEQCIPYEGNEHLLGTTDDCEDFYKTWTES